MLYTFCGVDGNGVESFQVFIGARFISKDEEVDELCQRCFYPFFLDESEGIEDASLWNSGCRNASLFI